MNWREYNPQNDLNPQDSIGENHNLLLEHFVNNIDKISVDSDKEFTIISDSISILLPKAIELLNISPDNQSKNRAYGACTAAIIESCDRRNLYLQITDYSQEFQNIWMQITNVTGQLTIENINDTLNELREIDNFIINSDLSDSEKTTIFQVNSIARYSSAYWVSEKDNVNSDWIEISEERGGDFMQKDPPNWVYTDIKAAYIGAWFTGNPLAALGAAAVSSAVDAAIDYYNEK